MPSCARAHRLSISGAMVSESIEPLHGMTCRHCGYVSVPRQEFGCENCGAHGANFTETALPREGTVHAAVTVHQHPRRDLVLPLRLGSIRLDAGPLIRARLASDVDTGQRVRATRRDGDLLFERLGES